jgi:hypothetical protein
MVFGLAPSSISQRTRSSITEDFPVPGPATNLICGLLSWAASSCLARSAACCSVVMDILQVLQTVPRLLLLWPKRSSKAASSL